jgi:hypothetical protein
MRADARIAVASSQGGRSHALKKMRTAVLYCCRCMTMHLPHARVAEL